MVKLSREEGGKYTPEELANLTLEEVKKMIEVQLPGAFDKKGKKAAAKKGAAAGVAKAPAKKAAKKASAKKATVKKAASKKAAPRKTAKK